MNVRFTLALFALLPALAACAAPSIRPNEPHEVAAEPLAPYAIHEACVELVPGDRLEYRWNTGAPVAFNIHFHEGNAVVMPVSREKSTGDDGLFQPKLAQHYCLMWEAGAEATTIAYRVRLVRNPK